MKKALSALAAALLTLPLLAQMPPTPGPEHDVLKKDVGTWDATVEMAGSPGAPAMTSTGVEKVTMLGGFWQLTEFQADMMGMPFEGRGITGFDPAKKKFVGTWVDSMTPGLYTLEGTYDAPTRTLTATMDGPDMTGAVSKRKQTTVWTGADTRVFSMYGSDGTTVEMKITYKRRK